ncbi:MAG TPA: hypothetical protein VIG69_12395 [Candidatus Methylomirabilis sp.]|jgi:hypothetical protein
MNDRERRRRMRLLRKARAGDAGALCILRERYHLRLPLIEQRIPYALPWMRRRGAGSRRERTGR